MIPISSQKKISLVINSKYVRKIFNSKVMKLRFDKLFVKKDFEKSMQLTKIDPKATNYI